MNTILDKWQEPNLKTKMNASKRSLSSSTRACDYESVTHHMACTDTGLNTCTLPSVDTLNPLEAGRKEKEELKIDAS